PPTDQSRAQARRRSRREARPAEDRQRNRTQGAKAACEGCGHLEGGEVARDRDWHGPSHLKRAWVKASTAILPLSPSFLCVARRTLAGPWKLRVGRSIEIFCSRSLPTSKSTGRPRLKKCVSNSLRPT